VQRALAHPNKLTRAQTRPIIQSNKKQQDDAAATTATAEPSASAPSSDADEPAAAAAPAAAGHGDHAAALESAKLLVDDAAAFAADPEATRSALGAALASAEAELDALRARAVEAEAAAEAAAADAAGSAREQFLRLSADFENFRRRTSEERADANARARGDVIASLLPLVDNFELARAQVKAETEAEIKVKEAYQGLYRQLVDLLKTQGVEAVPTEGSPFDPELHEAIAREACGPEADGAVTQEFRKGFSMGGRLLRPAMVKVGYYDGPAVEAGVGEGDGAEAAAAGGAEAEAEAGAGAAAQEEAEPRPEGQ